MAQRSHPGHRCRRPGAGSSTGTTTSGGSIATGRSSTTMIEFAPGSAAVAAALRRGAGVATDRASPRDRVLACATRLLDLGFFRIGTEGTPRRTRPTGWRPSARKPRHTSRRRRRHLRLHVFRRASFRRVQSVVDPSVARGHPVPSGAGEGSSELLAYNLDGRWVDIKSGDINAVGSRSRRASDFSAKDFRTWAAHRAGCSRPISVDGGDVGLGPAPQAGCHQGREGGVALPRGTRRRVPLLLHRSRV